MVSVGGSWVGWPRLLMAYFEGVWGMTPRVFWCWTKRLVKFRLWGVENQYGSMVTLKLSKIYAGLLTPDKVP